MKALLKKYSKSMRRLTGLLVSAAILCSMLPVTFSEGTETETATAEPTATATAAPTAAATEAPQTRLENGSFEYPKVEDKDCTSANGVDWCVQPRDYLEGKAKDTGFYWYTTAFDGEGRGKGKIELGFSGNQNAYLKLQPEEKRVPAHGDQFAELCAEDQGSLYQNLKTEPGTVFNWSLYHAARNDIKNNATESMALFIGAKQDASLDKNHKTDNTGNYNDIFMWMAKLLIKEGKITTDGSNVQNISKKDVNITPAPFTVYSKPEIDVAEDNITTSNYKEFFSLTPKDDITKEWKCWIMTTRVAWGWQQYKGTYDIPEGQTETTFAFTALTGHGSVKDTPDMINEGNLLDGIEFVMQFPLRVSTTAGGTGRVYTKFDPTDPDHVRDPNNPDDVDKNVLSHENEMVTAYDGKEEFVTQDHFDRYNDGTKLWVRTTPKPGYTFCGAYIDGTFHLASEDEYFQLTKNGKGGDTYYHEITMDKARYIQLVYTKDHTVIFDPNGGWYNNNQANTEISSGDISKLNESTYTSGNATYYRNHEGENLVTIKKGDDLIPTPDVNFVGWYIGPFPSYYKADGSESPAKGALIDGTVKIRFVPDENNIHAKDEFESTYKYTYGDMETLHTYQTDANDGLTFVAQWEYLQTAKAMTMEETATHYENNTNGGSVRIDSIAGDESALTHRSVTTVKTVDGTDQYSVHTDTGGDPATDGKLAYGHARLKDKIKMTAVQTEEQKGKYVFRGWYENDKLISTSTVFTYELGAGVRTIEARFRAILQYPYLSFVSQEATPQTTEAPFAEGTNLKLGTNEVEGYRGGTGQTEYGNTISTGFSTVQTFSDIAYDRCLWTITIPAVNDTSTDPLYIKSDTAIDGADVILTDTEEVQYNKGTIYKIKSFNGQNILLRANLPTITGTGQAVFAVIIDNIYAPGATATLDLKTESDDPAEGSTLLTESNSYTYNAGNEYQYYQSMNTTDSGTQSVP